jgi:uncharacterized membrane protein
LDQKKKIDETKSVKFDNTMSLLYLENEYRFMPKVNQTINVRKAGINRNQRTIENLNSRTKSCT